MRLGCELIAIIKGLYETTMHTDEAYGDRLVKVLRGWECIARHVLNEQKKASEMCQEIFIVYAN